MNKVKLAVLTVAALVGVVAFTPAYDVGAAPRDDILSGASQSGAQGGPTLEARIATITTILLFVIGAVSVIMIIVGGIRYVVSAGDSSKIKAAKDTIMYSVVGLVVALLAYAIVRFVIDQF